jgi:hypothetical protein
MAANSNQTLRVESAAGGRSNVRESSVIVRFRDFGVQIQNNSHVVVAFHTPNERDSERNLLRLPSSNEHWKIYYSSNDDQAIYDFFKLRFLG